tara:strand:+ start:1885 stop:2907 length:1023 start_codon:yes stop_codon:yes gene_type:complete
MKNTHFLLLILLFVGLSCKSTKDDSSITDLGRIFVSSNTQTKIAVFDFSDSDNISKVEFITSTNDADGIYYDGNRDIVYQADREYDRINAFAKLSTNEASSGILPTAISVSDFSNPRGLTSDGNVAIVAQDASDSNNQQNGLFMYDVSADLITLRNQYTVDFPLWDIQLVGNTLYAVEDESDSIAVFNNFFDNTDGFIEPDFKIRIEGIVRTHGLHYSLAGDLMIITDIGDAEATAQDGKLIIIEDFSLKLSTALQEPDETISLTDQIIITGSNTLLRNPVDVVFHEQANRIIVAERATNGGMILSFEYPNQTDQINTFNNNPDFSENYAGISGLYINSN